MIHARSGRVLAALALFAAPSLAAAQEPGSEQRIRALNEAAQAQRAVPEAARDAAWKQEHERTLYHLGVNLAAHVPEGGDRAYFQHRALSVLEELVFTAGDGSAMALHAHAVLGDVYAARGEWEEAATYYRYVAATLLGDPGSEPRRLEPVPAPRLEPREPAPEPSGEDVFENRPEPAEGAEDALETRFERAARVLDAPGAADAIATAASELEAAIREAPESPLRLRAELLLGDLRAERDEWEEAARRYAAVVRSLVGDGAGDGVGAASADR